MRKSIENSIITFVNNVRFLGLFKTIQLVLFDNQKNVCPRGCKW